MKKAKISESRIIIPTYPEGKIEDLPMFAENRVHQRTSGRPYPNKVIMSVDRSHKENKEYELVTLENEYLKVDILPSIGGRIYAALDKQTGYDFFYKQHVIKPALIGALGSWISGGVEFNWPYHHRPSGFMPCDYVIEEFPDGGVACHLSEHDPIDRMKAMVSIILRPGEKRFETRMRLYNRTAGEKSFLWWENAAVPVNREYRIFFPQDVGYVNFHYLNSRTTFPIAGKGVYNGIPMPDEVDISWHKNTVPATSYFSCASEFDFFGGYDEGKKCGVVHIGDHHISPGKKMFTWGYGQLARSWEKALTDTDGQYAELMAGSYSDNQPNFSWLAPYETKEFSQYWYPISGTGVPSFANLDCAFTLDGEKGLFRLQTTKAYRGLRVRIFDADAVYVDTVADLEPTDVFTAPLCKTGDGVTVSLVCGDQTVASYTKKPCDPLAMPPINEGMPSSAEMNDADELYLAGVHVQQYRDPAVNPDAYWKKALQRNIRHIPSLIAMADYEASRYDLDAAKGYAERAVAALNRFNERHRSGEAYYTYGKILEMQGETDRAYDQYFKASYAADSVAKAMTRIALIDLRRRDYAAAARHAQNALDYGANNHLAAACLVIAKKERGEDVGALVAARLAEDPLDHMLRFLGGREDLYAVMDSDPVQTCLDLAYDLSAMGRNDDIVRLLSGLEQSRPDCRNKPLYYALGYFSGLCGGTSEEYYEKAAAAPLGRCYPSRFGEIAVLEDVRKKTGSDEAAMLLGCLYYNKLHYEKAAALWASCKEAYPAKRNLAVACFSHLGQSEKALPLMKELLAARPDDEQLLYETVVLMDKTGAAPEEKIALLLSHAPKRDDLITELAKAYNQSLRPDDALKTLLSHVFVPCEGGEHAIADQYLFAHLAKAKAAYAAGQYREAAALCREGQTLPESLGAGIWNRCKLVPLRYHEAISLEKCGEKEKADEIFRDIVGIEIEFFSKMHLVELPYFQAKACLHLGEAVMARQIMTKAAREWARIGDGESDGFFSTTPFFLSFVDDPKRLRAAQYLYLTALCDGFKGDGAAAEKLRGSIRRNNENLLALLYEKTGFPD